MVNKQEEFYELILSQLGILSPWQLDRVQNIIQSMLQDLEMENETTTKVKYI